MAEDPRLQVPGGWMSTQDLRDLVGWAGAAGASELRLGDSQDWILEAPASTPGPAPGHLVLKKSGSLQSSAYGTRPASLPWLTTGVWIDLLSTLPDPGDLDVQILHDPERASFYRWGHLRLTASKAPHRWEVTSRRPGSDRLVPAPGSVDTGQIPALIEGFRKGWEDGRDELWQGESGFRPGELAPTANRESFHDQTPTTFSFGVWPPGARFPLEWLRDLAWLAWDSQAPRIAVTPDRLLVFQGIPQARRSDWERWLVQTGRPAGHGELEHALQAAGRSVEARTARQEVLDHLRRADRMPPHRGLLVADEGLNRGDGVCAVPRPILIRTATHWLFRSADGHRSGEGTLEQVLTQLERPGPSLPEAESTPGTDLEEHRCGECWTVYDLRWGDPQGGIPPGTAFQALPSDWSCPVCGGPPSSFLRWTGADNGTSMP